MTKIEKEFESKVGKAVDASPYGSDFTILAANLEKIRSSENKEAIMKEYVENDSISTLITKEL